MTISGQIKQASRFLWPRLANRLARTSADLYKARQPANASPEDHFVSQLSDHDRVIAHAAATAFLDSIRTKSLKDSAFVVLAAVVNGYSRRSCPEIADALILLRGSLQWHAVRPNPLASIVADSGHPIHLVVRGRIRRGAVGDDVALLWRVMIETAWASACAERLRSRLTQGEIAWLRKFSHLAENPRRALCTGVVAPDANGIGALRDALRTVDMDALKALAQSNEAGVAAAALRALDLRSPRRHLATHL